MKTAVAITLAVFFLSPLSCGSGGKGLRESGPGSDRFRSLAFEKYGDGAEFRFNEKKTAVLCLKETKPTSQHPESRVSFFVFDFSIDSTIFEHEIANGSVRWKDDSSLVVIIVPGIVKNEEPAARTQPGYIFDLRSRKTRSIDASRVQ